MTGLSSAGLIHYEFFQQAAQLCNIDELIVCKGLHSLLCLSKTLRFNGLKNSANHLLSINPTMRYNSFSSSEG